MATQLGIFNEALSLLGERSLASTADATEPARVLNALWDHVRRYCLEQGPWKFAERQATLSPAVGPPAAYNLANGFAKPADFIKLNAVATDLDFETPVIDLHERGGYWYSDASTIHIQYVSSDASFGYDLSLWPESFALFVTHYLAVRAAPRINSDLIPEAAQPVVDEQGNPKGGGYLGIGLRNAYEAAIDFNRINGPSQFLPDGDTTRLSIFNNVMNLLGGQHMTKITDATESAKILLGLWDHAVDYCLEQGHWKFAEREVLLTPHATEIPAFGLRNAFIKPADFIRINEIAADEYFMSPIFEIHERGSYFYCDLDEVYLRYVSKDWASGSNLNRWPESFVLYFTLYLATRAASRLAPRLKQEVIESRAGVGLDTAKLNALSKDAVSGPTQFLPRGNWSSSRLGGRYRRGRNSRSSLYGS